MAMTIWGADRLRVAVLYAAPPSDEEWALWLASIRERAGRDARMFVETSSGPNAAQRKALADATRDQDVRFAILTDSIVVRGIVIALAWLGVPHRAFAVDQPRRAADYLGLTADEYTQLQNELPRMRLETKRASLRATPPQAGP
jgi:hypothetical protein